MRSNRDDFLTRHLREVPAFRALIRATECRLLSDLGDLPQPILDVGCGDGHFADTVFDMPVGVGVDLNLGSLKEAQQRKSYNQVLNASATALPFADSSFPTVISNCVIEHIPDLDAALEEIYRVLQPQGIFVTTVPCLHLKEFLAGRNFFYNIGLPPLGDLYASWFNRHILRHHHLYSLEGWISKFEQVGIQMVSYRYYLSRNATLVFDAGHYFGIPSLIARKIFNRWILWNSKRNTVLVEKVLRPLYEENEPEKGACIFIVGRKK